MRSNAEHAASVLLLVQSVAQERFFGRGWGRKYKVSFCSQIAQHLHQPYMFNERRVLHSLVIELNGGLGAEPQHLAIFGIYYQNNAVLGMFQLKFCIKTFKTCLLFTFRLCLNVAF